jgi:hypothetical protein
MKNNTTTPPEREWIRISESLSFTALGKTYIYSQLDINDGPIVTSLIRKRNALQGVRLVNLDSLRAFMASGIGKQGNAIGTGGKEGV